MGKLPPYTVPDGDRDLLECGVVLSSDLGLSKHAQKVIEVMRSHSQRFIRAVTIKNKIGFSHVVVRSILKDLEATGLVGSKYFGDDGPKVRYWFLRNQE